MSTSHKADYFFYSVAFARFDSLRLTFRVYYCLTSFNISMSNYFFYPSVPVSPCLRKLSVLRSLLQIRSEVFTVTYAR